MLGATLSKNVTLADASYQRILRALFFLTTETVKMFYSCNFGTIESNFNAQKVLEFLNFSVASLAVTVQMLGWKKPAYGIDKIFVGSHSRHFRSKFSRARYALSIGAGKFTHQKRSAINTKTLADQIVVMKHDLTLFVE